MLGKPKLPYWVMPMSFCVQATSCTSTWIFTVSPEMLCMYDWESWLGVGLHTGVGLVGGWLCLV